MTSLAFILWADPPISRIYSKGNTSNFSQNGSGVEKIADFRHLSRRISETVQDKKIQVAIDHQKELM